METHWLSSFSITIRAIVASLAVSLALGACVAQPEPAATPIPMDSTQTIDSQNRATDSPPPLPTPAPTVLAPISDSQATRLMFALLDGPAVESQAAYRRILAAEDPRFIPVFIEMLRANQISILKTPSYDETVTALAALSGQLFGGNWASWVEWYGGTDITPPPGFTGWKGKLLARLDPGFGEFLYADAPARLRVEEIQWGGVFVDGIPALDNPTMIPASEADYLEPDEAVFGLSIQGEARAYPLRIMDWHEMANDVVGGVPVSLAYCTLCGAGIAFDGRATDGNTYTFGSSGFLYRSNKLMYDRQTRTLWNQLIGEPVLGKLVDSDAASPNGETLQLDLLPVVLTTWNDWQEQHPDTQVLALETGYQRLYLPGAAYGDYFSSSETMFPVWQRSDLLDTKEHIYALRIDGVPKAYPIQILIEEVVVNDQVADTPLVLIASRGMVNAAGLSLRGGPVSYNAGSEVRAYERGEMAFSPGPTPDAVLDSAGRSWQVTETALVGPNGEQAPRINGHLAYWFGWYTFFPNTLVYGE